MTKQPHASWANIYDKAYELSFGSLYDELTEHTIAAIERVLGPTGSIVDFGAGTGRLTLPLLDRGYQVTAVEPCQEMADVLRQKGHGRSLDLFIAKMADFQPATTYDMALCVFTVIAYILNPDELKQSLMSTYKSLRPGGVLILEVPSRYKFVSQSTKTPEMSRDVIVRPTIDDHFEYIENIRYVNHSGETETASDRFTIRCWELPYVKIILNDVGFVDAGLDVKFYAPLDSDYILVKRA